MRSKSRSAPVGWPLRIPSISSGRPRDDGPGTARPSSQRFLILQRVSHLLIELVGLRVEDLAITSLPSGSALSGLRKAPLDFLQEIEALDYVVNVHLLGKGLDDIKDLSVSALAAELLQ